MLVKRVPVGSLVEAFLKYGPMAQIYLKEFTTIYNRPSSNNTCFVLQRITQGTHIVIENLQLSAWWPVYLSYDYSLRELQSYSWSTYKANLNKRTPYIWLTAKVYILPACGGSKELEMRCTIFILEH